LARPAKSRDEKELTGNPGKRNLGEKEMKSDVYRYKIPTYLRGDLKLYVKDVVDELYRLGKSKLIYQGTFDGWCQNLSLRNKAFDELQSDDTDLLIKGERSFKKNPAIQVYRDFAKATLEHAGPLGMSGLTSDRVRGNPAGKNDPADEF